MRTIEKWLEEVVNPDSILGPVYRGEKTSLGDIYTQYFYRDPRRPCIKKDNTFKAPADGIVISNGIYNINEDTYWLKGAEFDLLTIIGNNSSFWDYLTKNKVKYVQIISIFMTFYSPHWNRVPIDSKLISRSHMLPIMTKNMPMVEVEDQIFKSDDHMFKMSSVENYYSYNERVCSHYAMVGGPNKSYHYELVQIADEEVNAIATYEDSSSCFAKQGAKFGNILKGSSCDLILPIVDGVHIESLPATQSGIVVEAGVDDLVKIYY